LEEISMSALWLALAEGKVINGRREALGKFGPTEDSPE